MRCLSSIHIVAGLVLVVTASACLSAEQSPTEPSSKYLDAVREFADNVLKYGTDTYGPKHTPLFVDGLNIHTHEPVKWLSPKGDVLQATEYNEWIISNFAAQQILMRTLDGLSEITGDPKYRNAAKQAIKYVFENVRSQNGLIYWGHAVAYDLQVDRVNVEDKNYYQPPYGTFSHCLKLAHPYYELMWQVDPKATQEFIEAFWSAHILDWSNLDMNRVGFFNETLEKPWSYEYKGGPVPFQTPHTYVHAFFNTGPILAHAGAILSVLSGHEQPLTWSKRLIQRYVDTRDPNIGISAYAYNDSRASSRRFPVNPFPYRFLDYPEERHVHPWLTVLLLGDMLGENGRSFTQWALEELTAWGKVSYREKDNSFVPMTIDGINLEGYVDEEAPKGLNVAEACPAGPQYFWAYSVAYQITGDPYMWEMVRNIALGNGLGDVGRTAMDISKLRTQTDCSDVYILLGSLRLYDKTKKPEFLAMARRIGDNIIVNKLHRGFFVQSKKHIYTTFDCFEPLALLHLEATINAQADSVPTVWPTLRQFVAPYRFKQYGIDRLIIYTLTESNEPPLSLQEAASIGDIDMVRTLVNGGTDVNSRDDILFATALHRAVWNGHKEIVEFLLANGADANVKTDQGKAPIDIAMSNAHMDIASVLLDNGAEASFLTKMRVNMARQERGPVDLSLFTAAKNGEQQEVKALLDQGADINAKDSEGNTALYYAIQGRHGELARSLIEKGADVSMVLESSPPALLYAVISNDIDIVKLLVENGARPDSEITEGMTVFQYAVSTRKRDIVELFISQGIDTSDLCMVACAGDLAGVKNLVEQGADINARDTLGMTPLYYAASMAREEVAEFLLDKGAQVDVKAQDGTISLHQAAYSGTLRLVELLVLKGADVNAKTRNNITPLHRAVFGEHKDIVEMLIARGADINAENRIGETPLALAKQAESTEIVELLTKTAEEQKAKEKEQRRIRKMKASK